MSIASKFYPYALAAKGFVKSIFTKYEDDGVTTGDVDFVVTWVDGNDPAWRAEKSKYDGTVVGNGACRYRDWVTFKYWFRAVEKYAPWVRYVYLITWGHVPEWLNLEAEKLRIVTHKEFIPQKYLPTYNSSAIELNMHRIKELSKHFVYFNDDVFLCRPANKTDFFINGKICYPSIGDYLLSRGNMVSYHKLLSIFSELNKKNNIREGLANNCEKWFSWKYGRGVLKNITLYRADGFLGMYHPHLALPVCKQAFSEAWDKYPSIDKTCANKFRSPMDVSHFLISIDQLLKGNYIPVDPKTLGKCVALDSTDEIEREFLGQNHKMICFNDSDDYSEEQVAYINAELERILSVVFPKKSSFEK